MTSSIYNQIEYLSDELSKISYMLLNEGKHSPEIDKMLENYDEIIQKGEFASTDPSPSALIKLASDMAQTLSKYKQHKLTIKNTIKPQTKTSPDVIQLRKKSRKSKPKIRKCSCKKK